MSHTLFMFVPVYSRHIESSLKQMTNRVYFELNTIVI